MRLWYNANTILAWLFSRLPCRAGQGGDALNLLHMKYAVVVAETHSINKAAERLFVGQPALSRAIKELESSLGVQLFERSSRGMVLTPNGELFVTHAKNVLRQVDEMERLFSVESTRKMRFSLSGPRASYIADAFTRFSARIGSQEPVELFYMETNSLQAITNLLNEDYKLGIVRYAEKYDKYYEVMMEEKGLSHRLVTSFCFRLLFSAQSPLAKKKKITLEDLRDLTEIAHADPYVPSLPVTEVKKEELPETAARRIFVFERATQFSLLSENPATYMWVSAIPQSLLDRYGLLIRPCEENRRVYQDILVSRKDEPLSELDRLFIDELSREKQELFGGEAL